MNSDLPCGGDDDVPCAGVSGEEAWLGGSWAACRRRRRLVRAGARVPAASARWNVEEEASCPGARPLRGGPGGTALDAARTRRGSATRGSRRLTALPFYFAAKTTVASFGRVHESDTARIRNYSVITSAHTLEMKLASSVFL